MATMEIGQPESLTLSIDQAAVALGIGRSLAYEMARTGQLPVIRLGAKRLRVPRARLYAMLEGETEREPEAA
jgi:excisionase family DNA binding protein